MVTNNSMVSVLLGEWFHFCFAPVSLSDAQRVFQAVCEVFGKVAWERNSQSQVFGFWASGGIGDDVGK
jgi:hypothetical protein